MAISICMYLTLYISYTPSNFLPGLLLAVLFQIKPSHTGYAITWRHWITAIHAATPLAFVSPWQQLGFYARRSISSNSGKFGHFRVADIWSQCGTWSISIILNRRIRVKTRPNSHLETVPVALNRYSTFKILWIDCYINCHINFTTFGVNFIKLYN